MSRLNFQRLWAAFPDHVKHRTLKDLYTALGGTAAKNIHVPGFGPNGNTCASRLSVAFNDGGSPIDMTIVNRIRAATIGTADGSRIIFRVSDFHKYLVKLLGEPSIDEARPYDDQFRGRQGIVAFSVNWQGATGHIALWNGSTYREPSYDDYSTYVNSTHPRVRTSLGEFWEIP